MKHTLFAIVFVFMSLFLPEARAQYIPDTTLSYATFLTQCQEFTRQQREEVWVVTFWASWNGASLNILPGMKQVHYNFRNKPVRFVSISVDKVRSIWERRLAAFQLPWEQLNIPREEDYSFLKRAFRHNSLPGIFVVNARGQIRRVRNNNELQSALAVETRSLPDRPYQDGGIGALGSGGGGFEDEPFEDRSDDEFPDPDPVWVNHIVQPGETLFGLYRKYGVSVNEIKRDNNLRSNNIAIGQILKIRKN